MSTATPALAALKVVDAEANWRAVEFIADLHLSDKQPRTVDALRRYLETTDADAVFMLGDVFEVWVGDDSALVPGFEGDCAELLQAAARQRMIAFMVGNRDFLVGSALLSQCGLQDLPDPSLLRAWNRSVLLTHGDALCLSDEAYQRFRAQVRGDAWRQAFLAKSLDDRRTLARRMRDASEAVKRAQSADQWPDIDLETTLAWLDAVHSRDLVHGHTHRPMTQILAPGLRRHVLSDWNLDAEPRRAQVLRLTPAGFSRRNLLAP